MFNIVVDSVVRHCMKIVVEGGNGSGNIRPHSAADGCIIICIQGITSTNPTIVDTVGILRPSGNF